MGKHEGKVAVITGGRTGIELAATQRFVDEGAHVFITGRRQAELDRAVERIEKNATAVQRYMSNLFGLDRWYEVVKREKGHVEVLLANAGPDDAGTTTAALGDRYVERNEVQDDWSVS